MMKRITLAASVLALLLTFACGCAPSELQIESKRTQEPAPSNGFVAQIVVTRAEGVTVTWLADGDEIVITTQGSSSCPLVPLRLDGEAAEVLVLGRDDGGSPACSADLAPTSTTIKRPDAWNLGAQITGSYTDTELRLTPSK